MEIKRVMICGGSIAGLSTAYSILRNTSISVDIYERKKSIGEGIVCAGGIASYMLREIKIPIPSECVHNIVRTIYFHSYKHASELTLKKEYGYIVDRENWEKTLADEIVGMGGKIHVKTLNPYVYSDKYDVIIGADGLTGISRVIVGRGMPQPDDVMIAIQAKCRSFEWDYLYGNSISLFFDSKIAFKGYGWVFPLGGSEFKVGTGVPIRYKHLLLESFNRLIEKTGMERIEKFRTKLVPTSKPEKNVIGEFKGKPVMLVGDAALHCDPSTGGGIAPAIICGQYISTALADGKPEKYNKLQKRIYSRNSFRYKIKEVLCELTDEELNELVELLSTFKPVSESIGVALLHLLIELGIRNPKFITKHKVLRRILSGRIHGVI